MGNTLKCLFLFVLLLVSCQDCEPQLHGGNQMGIAFFTVQDKKEVSKKIQVISLSTKSNKIITNYGNEERIIVKAKLDGNSLRNQEEIQMEWIDNFSVQGTATVSTNTLQVFYDYEVRVNPPNCESVETYKNIKLATHTFGKVQLQSPIISRKDTINVKIFF